MKCSLVVPCYNEEKNIPILLEKFKNCITKEEIEVIFVNNGSTDGSAQVLEKLIPDYPFARSVTVSVNQGYGYGILQGLKAAHGDFLGWTHADMQTDPSDVIKAYHVLAQRQWNESLYIKGKRKGRGAADRFFTAGMSFLKHYT